MPIAKQNKEKTTHNDAIFTARKGWFLFGGRIVG